MSETYKLVYQIILDHIGVCNERFLPINTAADFVNTKEGQLVLDAIATRLQAIGENVKKLVKHNPRLATKYPNVNWNEIVQFRDFISHHYELLDYEIVFAICKTHLPLLKTAIEAELRSGA